MQDAKKIVSGLVSKVREYRGVLTAILFVAIASVTSLASAQTATPIPVSIPNLDYAGVVTTLLTYVGSIAAVAIGLGLSVWGIKWVYRLFKGMAR